MRRGCIGLLGRILGHKFYVHHYWGKQPTSFCQRCGAVADE